MPDPMQDSRLDADAVRWRCSPEQFDFETTDQLDELAEILGQPRALAALHFGIEIRRDGYNIFALGPPGVGKRTVADQFLKAKAAQGAPPSDWCYVHRFDDSHRPHALRLPAGRGSQLREDMKRLVEDLRTALPAALESDEHRSRLQEIEAEFQQRHDEALRDLAGRAEAEGVRVVRTPTGFALAPMREGEVISPEEFEQLPDAEKKRIERVIGELEAELQAIIEQTPKWGKEARDRIRELNREVTRFATRHLMQQLRDKYADLPEVVSHLDAVEADVIEHAHEFRAPSEEPVAVFGIPLTRTPSFFRYEVNLLVDNASMQGSPVVYEDHPSYKNLVGRVEYQSHMGALITDFTLIKAGALHRANGGYLVIDAWKLLREPFAYEGLKRALMARQIKIESLGELLSLVSTVSLEPEPIPLDEKVVLIGDRLLYYLLCQYDSEFAELFKVAADFEEDMDRSPESCRQYARYIATIVRREKLRPMDRRAVALAIEHAARLAGDATKLSIRMRAVADLLREADYWAAADNAAVVGAGHLQRSIDEQVYRADRVRARIQEEIRRGTLLVDTDGERIGQVNGLAVLELGNFVFARPSRITATARLGSGQVVDIEREVKLGGAIHSKGVLILSAFLASRYGRDYPLSMSASLVFEQSYGLVEGDSASAAELCALLSALAELPVKQSLAVTGSVNQHGRLQAIGAVSEKIEGFFDVCRQRGLTGNQGVIIPKSNLVHLMLREDVVQAVAAGTFHVYAVDVVDEAMELLTGLPAGRLDDKGEYPLNTVNRRVDARLIEMSKQRTRAIQSTTGRPANE